MPAALRQVPGIVSGCLLICVCLALPATTTAQVEAPDQKVASGEPLTLREAHVQAVRLHPTLTACSEGIRAREAEALQAGLRPNPVISLEAENVFGSGDFSGTDAAETTISLSQSIELGNKRRLRREAVDAEAKVAGSDCAQSKADVLAKTSESFFAVLVAQERLSLADEMVAFAGQVLATVEEQIESGKAPATERLRANILRREQLVARDRARRNLSTARSALAASMGLTSDAFGPVAGGLYPLPGLPGLAELEEVFANSPFVAQWAAETERHRRAVALARAERIPELELGIGVRHLRESDDTALVMGISVPLAVFNRNQGGIAAARSRQAQARAQQQSALLQARAALVGAWQDLAAARGEAEALAGEILPDARKTLEAIEYGYRAGKFGILDVLDAQRTLTEVQGRHLDALAAFYRAEAEMNRLLGSGLPESANPFFAPVATKE